MVEIICDTSFLIHLANNRIKNLHTLDTDIGSVRFVVPDTVISELTKLTQNPEKKESALAALDHIKSFKVIQFGGSFADSEFISYVKSHGGVVATMDRDLKASLKKLGGSVMSISNNKIVLE